MNHSSHRPRIAVLATGGTIACTADANGALVPTVDCAGLLDAVASSLKGIDTVAVDLVQLDSSSITLADLDLIVSAVHEQLRNDSIDGVVLTHGTDSMEETAMALDLFHDRSKPVVMTGAQRAFDHPQSDGLTNLVDALRLAARGNVSDVVIQFGSQTIPARGVYKKHTTELRAFSSIAVNRPSALPLPVTPLAGNKVATIAAYPGGARLLIDAAVSAGYQGLVVSAMGSGNMGPDMGAAVADALREGVKVVISSRVAEGDIKLSYGGAGGGATLADLGAVGSGRLRAGQARIALAAALATGTDVAELV